MNIKWRKKFIATLIRPSAVVVAVVMLSLAIGAAAGSLTPSALPAATMNSLADIYNSIVGTFDSSAVVANQNGSLMQNLKYIETNLGWASGSNNIWSLASGNVGIGTTAPEEGLHLAAGKTILVTDDANPTLVAIASAGGKVHDVAVSDNTLVAGSTTGIKIYDITVPSSPALVSTIACTLGNQSKIKIYGSYLYAGCAGSSGTGINIYDISNRANPVLLSLLVSEVAQGFDLSGRYLYVSGHYTGFNIWDVSNPKVPVRIKNFSTGNWSLDVVIHGKYLYIANFSGHFIIYNISDPTNPILMASNVAPSGGSFHGIYVSNNYAYLFAGPTKIVDIANVASPSTVGSIEMAGNFWSANTGLRSGRYLYMAGTDKASSTSAVFTYDVSNPSAPLFVGMYATSKPSTYYSGLAIKGRYLYYSGGTAGIHVFDIGGIDVQGITGGSFTFNSGEITENLTINGNINSLGGLNIKNGIQAYMPSGVYASTSAETVFKLTQSLPIGTGGNLLDMYASASRVFSFQASTSGSVNMILHSPSATGNDGKFSLRSAGASDRLDIMNGANTTLMTIASSGYVGIGTTTPDTALDVNGVILASISATGTNTLLTLKDGDSTCNFTAEGGGPTCGSDIRLKKDIVALPSTMLDKLTMLNPVTYHWNTESDSDAVHTGFIAQEVQQIFPDLVSSATWVDGNPALFLSTNGLIPYMVKAIQELRAQTVAFSDQLFASIIDAFKNTFGIVFEQGKIKADTLCAGSVCVNEQQLQELLQRVRVSAPSETPTPSLSPSASPTPDVSPSPSPSESPTETPTPMPSG